MSKGWTQKSRYAKSYTKAPEDLKSKSLQGGMWTLRPYYGAHRQEYLPDLPFVLIQSDQERFDATLGLFFKQLEYSHKQLTPKDYMVCNSNQGRFIYWAADKYLQIGAKPYYADGMLLH